MRHRMPIALITILALAGVARADDGAARLEATQRRSAELLEHIDRPDPGKGWLALHLNRLEVHKKTGLAYTREIHLGERGVAFSVRGPALGLKKHLGLSLEIRF